MKRLLPFLLALLFSLTLTGCGGKDLKDLPTSPGFPEGKSDLTAQLPSVSEFLSKENLANTRWVAVGERIIYSDGTTVESDLHGFGYELFLFADGTAQWLQIDAADRRPLCAPYGVWTISEGRVVFSGQEDSLEDAFFHAENGGLVWERGENLEVRLEPAEMLQWLTPLPPEALEGFWQLEFMSADGCDYGMEDLHFDSSLRIAIGADGAPVVDCYYSTEFGETRLCGQALAVLWDERPAATGWAPWVAELSTGKDVERSLLYLGSPELLYVEDFYYMDGAPAVALYRYRCVPEHYAP